MPFQNSGGRVGQVSPQGNHVHRASGGGDAEDRSELLRRGWSGRWQGRGTEEAEKGQRDVVAPVTW